MQNARSQHNNDKDREISSDIMNEIMSNPDSDSIDSLDNDQLKEIVRTTARYRYFSGPLPDPGTFKKYEDALPGTADRILTMAEKQAAHRQYVQKRQVDTESRDSLLGILSAFFIALAILVCGTLIVIVVKGTIATVAGSVLDLAGIATIIGTFLRGTSNSWKNQNDKESKDK